MCHASSVQTANQSFQRYSAKFELYVSKTQEQVSVTVKLFITQFVNTALLTLLINGNPDYFTGGTTKTSTSGMSVSPSDRRNCPGRCAQAAPSSHYAES